MVKNTCYNAASVLCNNLSNTVKIDDYYFLQICENY